MEVGLTGTRFGYLLLTLADSMHRLSRVQLQTQLLMMHQKSGSNEKWNISRPLKNNWNDTKKNKLCVHTMKVMTRPARWHWQAWQGKQRIKWFYQLHHQWQCWRRVTFAFLLALQQCFLPARKNCRYAQNLNFKKKKRGQTILNGGCCLTQGSLLFELPFHVCRVRSTKGR